MTFLFLLSYSGIIVMYSCSYVVIAFVVSCVGMGICLSV